MEGNPHVSPSLPLLILLIYSEIIKASSISYKEVIGLIASFHSNNETSVDLSKKGYTPQQLAAMQQAASRQKQAIASVYLGYSFTQPLSKFKLDNFDYFAFLFNQFDKFGTLPFTGSLTNQPNKIVECFNVIKALQQEAIDKEQTAQQQKMKRKR